MSGGEFSFPPLQNDNIIRAAFGKEVDRIPVWIMRQAGRYLPEFREMRSRHDFFEICQTPELACEVTLQPIRRFDLDAAIIFSDILVIPQALGMEVVMKPGVGPHFPKTLQTPADLDELNISNVNDRLRYVFDAITLTRKELKGKVPLIGFSGGPWTLMCYMVDGGGSPIAPKSRRWLYEYPEGSKKLLQVLTNRIIDYLKGQVDAGAQLIQVFETNAGLLSPELFDVYFVPYLEKIATELHRYLKEKNLEVPLIIFAKGGVTNLGKVSRLGFDVVSLDWTVKPSEVRDIVPKNVSVQGNMDPCALFASKEQIEKILRRMILDFGPKGYIANLGHGILPDTNPEHAERFIDGVHSASQDLKDFGLRSDP